MGIKTVAVHSTADAGAMSVRLADETVCVGPPPARDSYLNVAAILSAAAITGAEAIHPGLGFLAEDPDFAAIVEEHGFVFIGPSAEHIRLMGNKVTAKEAARKLGIPTVPGSSGAVRDLAAAESAARTIGYPVLIKATAGGGGRGMKIARNPAELVRMLPITQHEAASFFGNGEVYLERYLERPRHIEIQILGDGQGGIVHLGERDCSLQRSHQKVLEETPSPALNPEERGRIGALAVAAMQGLGYKSAGTLEFLYQDGQFFFIEMNTRLQVEHPITEMISGIDIVREQLRIAAGAPLGYRQADIALAGHAIECRINAENPETFTPAPGGRSRRSRRQRPLSWLRGAALLRQPDLEAGHPRQEPERMPDAAASGIGGICDRRHRDYDPIASATRHRRRFYRRRLRHRLARTFRRASGMTGAEPCLR